jgi:tRNA(Arg) A34 adenosine deaminase TadA
MQDSIQNSPSTIPHHHAMTIVETDLAHLRRAIALARQAREAGSNPFAAVIVAEDGSTLAEAVNNTRAEDGDPTQHAELLAVALASRRASTGQLQRATLYASAEPCCMCAGAIHWGGIARVVYGLSERRLGEIAGEHPENPPLSLSCREVLAHSGRKAEVIGPLLEDEAAAVHQGYWV